MSATAIWGGASRRKIAHKGTNRIMTLDEYNTFCGSFPAGTHVVQAGGSDVWKVGGKVFAIAEWGEDHALATTFEVSEIAYDVLRE
jgi:predicted DNA-binding protein (MmcQ/YjbR family)